MNDFGDRVYRWVLNASVPLLALALAGQAFASKL